MATAFCFLLTSGCESSTKPLIKEIDVSEGEGKLMILGGPLFKNRASRELSIYLTQACPEGHKVVSRGMMQQSSIKLHALDTGVSDYPWIKYRCN